LASHSVLTSNSILNPPALFDSYGENVMAFSARVEGAGHVLDQTDTAR
jgi:hypothetical protein